MSKKLTKEEFLEKLKTDRDFNNRYGRKHVTEGKMVLPPCHYVFQVYTRELSLRERKDYAIDILNYKSLLDLGHNKNEDDRFIECMDKWEVPTRAISLMWNQRSVDTFLGLPFNIASYGLLLEIIAKIVNMVPDELICNLGDTHLYSNHIEQAKEQIGREMKYSELEELDEVKLIRLEKNRAIQNHDYETAARIRDTEKSFFAKLTTRTREPFPLPTLKHMKTDSFYKSLSENVSLFGHLDPKDFQLENYQSHTAIKAHLSN